MSLILHTNFFCLLRAAIQVIVVFVLVFTISELNAQLIRTSKINHCETGTFHAFSFVHISDIHIGEGIDDYGSSGYLTDTIPEGDVGYAAIRLRKTVNWINANAQKHKLKFVVITGDLTDSGEKSEFEKARDILDDLQIPYIPQIGNHDVKCHTATLWDTIFRADSLSNAVFERAFDRIKLFADTLDNGYKNKKVFSPLSNQEVMLQNFKFIYKGFTFLFADLSPRFKKRPKTDRGPKPRLNDFENGSFQWLCRNIDSTKTDQLPRTFILTHQPPHRDIFAIFNGLPTEDYKKITDFLLLHKRKLAFWLAGHVHRNRSYRVRTLKSKKFVLKARETTANKEHRNGALRVVKVYDKGL